MGYITEQYTNKIDAVHESVLTLENLLEEKRDAEEELDAELFILDDCLNSVVRLNSQAQHDEVEDLLATLWYSLDYEDKENLRDFLYSISTLK